MSDVPSGFFKGRALRGEFGKAKTGNDQILVEFEITEGEHAGKRVYWYGSFSVNAEKRTVESLRYCGCTFPGGDITDLAGLSDNEVSLDVQKEVYENKERTKVAWVNKLDGAGLAQKMTDGEKLSFRERMKGTVLATAQQSGQQAAAPANGTASRPAASSAPAQGARAGRPF